MRAMFASTNEFIEAVLPNRMSRYGSPNTQKNMTSVSGEFRTTLTYAAAAPRSTGMGDTRIAASSVPPIRQPISVTPNSDSVPQVPLRNVWMSVFTGVLRSPCQVVPEAAGGHAAGRPRAGPRSRWRSAPVRSVAVDLGLLDVGGVAQRVLEGLRPGAVLHRGLERVVDRVAQRLVVLGHADAVGLLREGLACDRELSLVLRGVPAEDRVIGRDGV